jgi:hypothetical protein
MGKKSAPKPPPPPDPREIAQTDAEYNRIDQYTPYGSFTYSGPNRNVATLNLSPEVQQLFDSQLGIDRNLLGEALSRFGSLDSEPIDMSQFGPIQTDLDLSNVSFDRFDPTGLPELNSPTFSQMGAGPDLRTFINAPELGQVSTGSNFQGELDPLQVQTELDMSGVRDLPGDYDAYRQDVQDAFFQRQRDLLDPYFSDQARTLEQSLANRGHARQDAGYATEDTRFQDRRNEAYIRAANDAILNAGAESSRQLSDILRTQGQEFGQALAGGQFGNQAIGQQFGQNLAAGQFGNQAERDRISSELAQMGFNNNALANMFGMDLQSGQFQNDALQQMYQNQMAGTGFNNDALQQMYQNQFNNTGFNNDALQQMYQNQFNNTGFNNDAQQQMWQNNLLGTDFNNQAALMGLQADAGIRGQLFGEQAATSEFNNNVSGQNLALQQQLLNNANAGRAQQIAEQTGIRNNQFNELAALLGLQQVNQPGISDYFGPGQTDVTGAYALNQAGVNRNFDAAMNAHSAGLTGLMGMGASFLGGPLAGNIFDKIFE